MSPPNYMFMAVIMCAAAVSEGKRVVVVPLPLTSHANYHANVARELVKLGHEVWITMPDYLVAKGVLNNSTLTVIEYKTNEGNVEENCMSGLRDCYFQGECDIWVFLFDSLRTVAEDLLRNDTFFQTLKAIRADMYVFDNLPFFTMLTKIPYKLGIPFSFLESDLDPLPQRVPFFPVTLPIVLVPFNDHMSFSQRVANTLLHLLLSLYDLSVEIVARNEQEIANTLQYLFCFVCEFWVQANTVAENAPEMPYIDMHMLIAKAEIWLVEQDHIMDYANPFVPKVNLIGGAATGPAKPLSPPFQSFMDDAAQGVIIVTFGSYVLDFPKDLGDKIFTALLQIPLKSVLRSRLTSPDPEKIMTASWLPQNDMLGHGNTRLFVGHCGKNSQYEALYHAVPMICMPMFTDQFYNAERVRVKGFAEVLDLRSCTAEKLASTIVRVARDYRYQRAVSKSSRLFKELYGVPKERAAWWLEHVMLYGGGHFRSESQKISQYQSLLQGVILFLVFVVFFLVLLICVCIRGLCRCLCKRTKHKAD